MGGLFSLITNLIPQVKIGYYGVIGLFIAGFAIYFFYQKSEISNLEARNQILQTNVDNLNTSNLALQQQIKNDKIVAAELQGEVDADNENDSENQKIFTSVVQKLVQDTPTMLENRNNAAKQQTFISTINSDLDCYYANFNNGEPGSCVNGVFVPVSSSQAAPQ